VTISWPFDPTVDAGLAAMSLGYAWLARRVGAPRRNAFYFCIGLLIVWLALETPLDTLADHYLMSAHMAQHMLLMAVARHFSSWASTGPGQGCCFESLSSVHSPSRSPLRRPTPRP
jgi:putative membrane protein